MINNELKLSIIEEANKIKTKISKYNRNNTNNRRLFSKAIKKEIVSFHFKYKESGLEPHKLLGISKQSLQRWITLYPPKISFEKDFKKINVKNKAVFPKESPDKVSPEIWSFFFFNRLVVLGLISLEIIEQLFLR